MKVSSRAVNMEPHVRLFITSRFSMFHCSLLPCVFVYISFQDVDLLCLPWSLFLLKVQINITFVDIVLLSTMVYVHFRHFRWKQSSWLCSRSGSVYCVVANSWSKRVRVIWYFTENRACEFSHFVLRNILIGVIQFHCKYCCDETMAFCDFVDNLVLLGNPFSGHWRHVLPLCYFVAVTDSTLRNVCSLIYNYLLMCYQTF